MINNSNADEYAIQASQDVLSNTDDFDVESENCDMEVDEEDQDYMTYENGYHKPLTKVCPIQKYRRTRLIIKYLNEAADKNKVTLNELLGIVLNQVNYRKDKKICDVGKQLIDVEQNTSHIFL